MKTWFQYASGRVWLLLQLTLLLNVGNAERSGLSANAIFQAVSLSDSTLSSCSLTIASIVRSNEIPQLVLLVAAFYRASLENLEAVMENRCDCGYPLLRSGVGFSNGTMWLTYICSNPRCQTIYVEEGRYAFNPSDIRCQKHS
jgi:hypothetical protein